MPRAARPEIVVPLGADAKTWDEFQPNLHKLDVALASPSGKHVMQTALDFARSPGAARIRSSTAAW